MDVLEWARGSEMGRRVVYAELTARDDRGGVATSMATAYRAHQEGLVFLAQRRAGDAFRYEATRISHPTAKLLKLVGPGR